MSAPRLCIDLEKIQRNARILVQRMRRVGISVTGVSKAAAGYQPIARAMRLGGVWGVGDSRLQNMPVRRAAQRSIGPELDETVRRDGPLWLLRTPMLSDAARVVALTDISSNSELDVMAALSAAACQQKLVHGVVLMIEMGDLREGILPGQLDDYVRKTIRFPGIRLMGIGTNLACLSGVIPDNRNMNELSRIACATEREHGIRLQIVSGGNSANLNWVAGLGSPEGRGRINNLRLGEAILLGTESIARRSIPGLHTDAFSLVGEVIESKRKPVCPTGKTGQTAVAGFERDRSDKHAHAALPDSTRHQAIVALGVQDTDPQGLTPPSGIHLLGASSDHLVIDSGCNRLAVGSEVAFSPDYSALMRAMTSPFVAREIRNSTLSPEPSLACQ